MTDRSEAIFIITPFLLISIWSNFCNIFKFNRRIIKKPDNSLFEFSFFWLIAVFVFFTISATKLPSYWLPATPAASVLISLSLTNHVKEEFLKSIAWKLTIFLSILLMALAMVVANSIFSQAMLFRAP